MTGNGQSILFYWRPGCGFCAMLERDLQRAEICYEPHNIWEDPEAAAFVRSAANGTETVPTLVVGDHAMVNPTLPEVVAAMDP